MPGDPRIRASDADRDRAAALLREHHAAGRLTAEEFGERLDQAMAAKTLGELDELLADLPAIDLYELPEEALRRQRGLPRWQGPPSTGPGEPGLPWGSMAVREGQGRVDGLAAAGQLDGLSAGAAAMAAWVTVAATLILIGLVTGALVGGLSAWWLLAAIAAGAVSSVLLLLRKLRRE